MFPPVRIPRRRCHQAVCLTEWLKPQRRRTLAQHDRLRRLADGPGGGVGHTVPEGRGASASPDADVQRNISADDVRQYRTALAINARRYKRYPALAREQGWEGNVEIAIDFRKAVPNPEVSLVRSSGKAVLDDQALEMIRQAARVTEMPSRLADNEFRVVLPVEFSLEEMR